MWAEWVLVGEGCVVALFGLLWLLGRLVHWWQWGLVDPFSDDARHRYADTPYWSRGYKGRKPNDPNRNIT